MNTVTVTCDICHFNDTSDAGVIIDAADISASGVISDTNDVGDTDGSRQKLQHIPVKCLTLGVGAVAKTRINYGFASRNFLPYFFRGIDTHHFIPASTNDQGGALNLFQFIIGTVPQACLGLNDKTGEIFIQ